MLRLLRLGRLARERVFWRYSTLEPLIETEDSDQAVHFLTSVALNGISRPAIAVSSGASARCRVRVPARATLVAYCGVDGDASARAKFELSADGVTRNGEAGSADGWVPLSVPLSTGAATISIQFRAVLLGGDHTRARLMWGAPSLRWPRGTADTARLVWLAMRQYGWHGTLARLRAHGQTMGADPQAAYRSWLAARTPDARQLEAARAAAGALASRPRFAIFIRGASGDETRRTLESVARQVYAEWEASVWTTASNASALQIGASKDARLRIVANATTEADARNDAISGTGADFVVALDGGDEITADALLELATAIAGEPAADVVYSDEDTLLPDGPGDPVFKPAWSPEYLLSRNYLGRLTAFRRASVLAAGGFRGGLDGAHDYDVALRLMAHARVRHVPKVLCHRGASDDPVCTRAAERRALEDVCATTGRDADVVPGILPGLWRVRHRIADTPRITIVLPTDARSGQTLDGPQPLVTQCIRSILERTSYANYDFVIADNGTLPESAAALLEGVPHARVTYQWTGPFNFSRKINFAVGRATGEFILLLNDDIEVINKDWLTAMLEYARQEAIGAVGAKLFYPDGRLQHVGVATGVGGIAAHLLHQHPGGSAGCGQMAFAVRNCSAVTGACLLTRRAVYGRAGGFDERMAVDFNDVDFCLKLRSAGYRIVFTPYAKLYHHESGSFGPRIQRPNDIGAMRAIWGATIDQDPYYNPNLSRRFADCRVAEGE